MNGRKFLLALTVVCFFGLQEITAQDIHFSQFYASPLTLNPTMTGFMEADFRLAGIYRNQWASVTTPFKTYSFSYDMRVLQNKLGKDLLGVGGMMFNDKSGDGDLTNMSFMVSASYHKAIGTKNYLALGVQGGYVQKKLDVKKLVFPSQYDSGDQTFNTQMQNGESNLTGDPITQIDVNLGLLWHGRLSDKVGLFNGFSYFHLTKPKDSFLGSDNRLSSRYVIHGGGKIKMSEKISLLPNYIVMLQNKAQEVNLGTAVEYDYKTGKGESVIFSLGAWYRLVDAVIFSASIDYKNARLGFAYDVNTSDLKTVSNGKGAYEISLIYLGFLPQSSDNTPIYVPCPRM